MTRLQLAALFSLFTLTTQLGVRLQTEEGHANKVHAGHSMYEAGGLLHLVGHHLGHVTEDPEDVSAQMPMALGRRRAEAETETEAEAEADNFPSGAWKAPKAAGAYYPGVNNWPIPDHKVCTADDMKELNYWALKQAKGQLPAAGYDGTFEHGKCFRQFYNISTACSQGIGAVYNMAIFNWSTPCYRFCYGKPFKPHHGSHWCWEDCQSCMWYIGHKLTVIYGEPYDMQCRYAKELGKEGWYEKNAINPRTGRKWNAPAFTADNVLNNPLYTNTAAQQFNPDTVPRASVRTPGGAAPFTIPWGDRPLNPTR